MTPAYENRSIAFTRVGKMRLDRKLTQDDLAELAGVSVPALQRLEAGRVANPGVVTLCKLAAALDCELDDLVEDAWRQGNTLSPPEPGAFHRDRPMSVRPRGEHRRVGSDD